MALPESRALSDDPEPFRLRPTRAAALEILAVQSKADLDRFIRVPWRLYRDDPQWVPPLVFERRQHLDPKTNPFFGD